MSPNQERSTLRELLTRRSVQVGGIYKLASGAKTDVYVDAKRTTCFSEAMPLVGRVFLRKIKESGWHPQAVGGLTIGADPVAFSIARESLGTGRPAIDLFIVRKRAKKHGMRKYIEGPERTEGLRVVIVDDVCTEGSSTGEAIEKALKAGMTVLGAICLVDREAGASKFLLDKFQCQLESIFKLSELLIGYDESGKTAHSVGAHK